MASRRRKTEIELQSCSRCGYAFPSTRSKCTSCGAFNIHDPSTLKTGEADGVVRLSDVEEQDYNRLNAGPWNPIFGGGITLGSTTLFGGAPGAGKSTSALQLADIIAGYAKDPVYYIAAEEANRDIKSRAKRLRLQHFDRVLMHNMMNVALDLRTALRKYKPSCAFIDSLKGIVGEDNAAAVELATELKPIAVETNCPIIIIDQVNKDLEFIGHMALQHAVDTTVSLFPIEDDIREAETIKNRFGPAGVRVHFRMTEAGLVALEEEQNEDCDEDEDEDPNEENAHIGRGVRHLQRLERE